MPENAAADCATKALEVFTAVMKSKRNRDILFTDKSINNVIGVLSNLLNPTRTVPTSATLPRAAEANVRLPRVDVSNNDNRPPRVNNNTDTPARVLRPRLHLHLQKYSRGTRVERIFGEVNRLKEHRGYICDFDKKEGYYKVKYQEGDTEEYNEEEIKTMPCPVLVYRVEASYV